MVTDPERMEAVLEDPYIAISGERLSSADELLPLLDRVIPTGRPLLILAEQVEGEALATLVVNKLRGLVTSVAVPTPEYGAAATRACTRTWRSSPAGRTSRRSSALTLDSIELSQLGRAERVVVDRDTTTIIGGHGDPAAVEQRIGQIRAELEENGHLNEFERDKLRERMARLGGQGRGDPRRRRHRDRAARAHAPGRGRGAGDARGAPRGHPPGRRRRAAATRRRRSTTAGLAPDEATGAEVVRRALEEPLRQIAGNAGFEPSVVVGTVRGLEPGEGLDAATGAYGDLVEAGVIDPTMVTRSALENAASIAKTVLVTECMVTRAVSEDDLVREAREVNDAAHQVVYRPPRS